MVISQNTVALTSEKVRVALKWMKYSTLLVESSGWKFVKASKENHRRQFEMLFENRLTKREKKTTTHMRAKYSELPMASREEKTFS